MWFWYDSTIWKFLIHYLPWCYRATIWHRQGNHFPSRSLDDNRRLLDRPRWELLGEVSYRVLKEMDSIWVKDNHRISQIIKVLCYFGINVETCWMDVASRPEAKQCCPPTRRSFASLALVPCPVWCQKAGSAVILHFFFCVCVLSVDPILIFVGRILVGTLVQCDFAWAIMAMILGSENLHMKHMKTVWAHSKLL